ncbi:MAG: GNAT family N-acetyltransferase [Phenylobacterium sp.]|uniref:GNAT family N-acetyltransferase n=1 Tax=Phenylobacterium sp. TaxID=1871053 RepID=UPI001A5FAEA9|nr:GNAT family N-acetyltransferase [Phenylobacterium sp.]MBL8553657.1 GNAT family N-acetyltransferase [Phenylobacterium sp.]
MEPKIVRVGPGDEALLDRVAPDVFDEAVNPAFLAAYLAERRHMMVLAVRDGVVVGQTRGMVHLSPDQPPELYVDNMGVTPALWRRGIGGRLLDELMTWGHEQGCAYAWLGTELDNIEARGLYESRRFKGTEMVVYELDTAD